MAFQQINTDFGFNHMTVNGLAVAPNREIFLRQPGGGYLSLGSFAQAAARAPGTDHVIGVNGDHLGNFGTPQIDNNLFVYGQANAPASGIAAAAAGGRSRRLKKYKAKGSRRSKKYGARKSRRFKKR